MKHNILILIILFIVGISLVATILIYKNSDGNIAEVYQNGKLLHQINLGDVITPYELVVESDGHTNTLLVEKDKISVKSANCPDKLCVKQGAISSSGYPIICLPNNLFIKIINSRADKVDALSR